MNYETFLPTSDLADWIKCYWTLESEPGEIPERQTIVPDGCMEMIFHYGDLYRQYRDEHTSIIQPQCFVIGQLTKPLVIEPTGATGIFAIRFQPGGFAPITHMPLHSFHDQAVELTQVFGEAVRETEQNILTATSTEARITEIETFLFQQLIQPAAIDRLVSSTIDLMLTTNGRLPVTELLTHARGNRRQLERKFVTHVGLSPKKLSRMIRLQATLRLVLTGQVDDLTSASYAGAYFDQSHFIRDFKELTGLTPKELYGDSLALSALFYRE